MNAPVTTGDAPATDDVVIGDNGVAIPRFNHGGTGWRSYEVHQRERVGESTEKINGAQLASAEYAADPYPLLAILRENYPCYRDWINNCYWITRYDDVTSIFTDEANFENRSKLWYYGIEGFGRDLREELPVLWAWSKAMDAFAETDTQRLIEGFRKGVTDLARDFAAQLPILLLGRMFEVPDTELAPFAIRYRRAQRGVLWHPTAQETGKGALLELLQYFEPKLRQVGNSDTSVLAAIAGLGGTAADVVTTLLEADHETLHGALGNLWMNLLSQPGALHVVKSDRLAMKIAYLEAMRHSPPVITSERFARHEVERFGKLIPEGGLLRVSALAANRDPRIFNDSDQFIADRRDICHREARGHYRADGLPQGIAFGMGRPTRHPAVPEDRPRSLYALTRDTAVTASWTLAQKLPGIALEPGFVPTMRCLRIGEVFTCWQLPVAY
ncbi:MAG: cytochrome P450 [Gammaproteobacteria bacterium]|nr:cytochrome P450 [Gammaproteobacteria bacterium]